MNVNHRTLHLMLQFQLDVKSRMERIMMVEKKELILFESGFLYGKGWLLVNDAGDSNKYGCIGNKIKTKRGCRR